MRQLRVTPDALADIEPVRIRQHDVEQDQIRTLAAAQFDRALPCLRTDEGKPSFSRLYFNRA